MLSNPKLLTLETFNLIQEKIMIDKLHRELLAYEHP